MNLFRQEFQVLLDAYSGGPFKPSSPYWALAALRGPDLAATAEQLELTERAKYALTTPIRSAILAEYRKTKPLDTEEIKAMLNQVERASQIGAIDAAGFAHYLSHIKDALYVLHDFWPNTPIVMDRLEQTIRQL